MKKLAFKSSSNDYDRERDDYDREGASNLSFYIDQGRTKSISSDVRCTSLVDYLEAQRPPPCNNVVTYRDKSITDFERLYYYWLFGLKHVIKMWDENIIKKNKS